MVPNDARQLILDFMLEYVQSVNLDEAQGEQIQASTATTWTLEQTIDFWEAVYQVSEDDPSNLYQRSSWVELENEGNRIRMQQDSPHSDFIYELIKDGAYTIIASMPKDNPEQRHETRIPNDNLQTDAGVRYPNLHGEDGELVWEEADIRAYLMEAHSNPEAELGEIIFDDETGTSHTCHTPASGQAYDLLIYPED